MTLPRLAPRLEPEPAGLAPGTEPPIAEFSAVPTGLSVQFTDQSTDPDGTIVAWQWDFGDAPSAAFNFSVNSLTVSFTDQSIAVPGGTIASWLWNFGDGNTSTAQNPVHSYAASGSYNATLTVTDNNGRSATAQRTVSLGPQGALGRFLGPYKGMASATSLQPFMAPFNALHDGVSTANQFLTQMATCRTLGMMFRPILTGGAHSNYITNGKFDFGKWKAKMDIYNTAACKAAVADMVTDGLMPGNVLMDEPQSAKDASGPDWGGVMTKALLDEMAAYAKAIFPTLPQGVVARPDWHYTEHYGSKGALSVDFGYYQYSARFPTGENDMIDDPGNVEYYRDYSLNMAALDGVVPTFGLNVLNGGYNPFYFGSAYTGCPIPLTGGVGENGCPSPFTSSTCYCRMTAQQLQDYGTVLLSAAGSGGLLFWEWESAFFSKTDNVAAFNALRSLANTLPKRRWSLRI
jgi:hypothetical protein